MGTDTDQQLYSEFLIFIDKIKQARYSKTLLRPMSTSLTILKLKQCQGGIHNRQSNNNNKTPTHSWYNHMNDNNNHNTSVSDVTNKWVVNLSNTPAYRSPNITSS